MEARLFKFFSSIIVFSSLLFVTCFDPYAGEELATIIIDLDGSAARVSAYPQNNDDAKALPLTYIITLEEKKDVDYSSSPRQPERIELEMPKGKLSHSFQVKPGTYWASVNLCYNGREDVWLAFAYHTDPQEVRIGRTTTFKFTMNKESDLFIVDNADDWSDLIDYVNNYSDSFPIIIDIRNNVTVDGSANYTFEHASSVNLTFLGNGKNLILSEFENGSLLNIGVDHSVNIIDLHLKGIEYNNAPLVVVADGAKLTLNGSSSISGNQNSHGEGGGVFVGSNSYFYMYGGIIYGNSAEYGGGVYVDVEGTFNITNGMVVGSNYYGNLIANDAYSGAALYNDGDKSYWGYSYDKFDEGPTDDTITGEGPQ